MTKHPIIPFLAIENIGYFFRNETGRQGKVATSDTLRDGYQIGFHTKIGPSEPITCPSKCSNNFVGYHQDIVLLQDGMNCFEILIWRHKNTTRTRNWFGNECRNRFRALCFNQFVEFTRQIFAK